MGQLIKSRSRFLCAAACVLLTAGFASQSLATDLPAKAPGAPLPMAVGGWLYSPTVFVGGVYNSNVNQSETNKVSSWGERAIPGFTASLNNGIHQTSIYGLADIQNYAANGANHKTTIDAKAGITQTYLATRDSTFTFNGDFTRQADVFGSSAFAPANTPLAPTSGAPIAPTTVSPQANPDRYNQYSGGASFDQRFGRTFVGVSAGVVHTQFDSSPNTAFLTSRDGTVYTVAERTGFDLTPQIYAFVDPAVSWQRYSDSTRDSNGYRVTGGLGTSAAGLWQGEIFGGYQAQKNDTVGTYGSGVYGVRIGYSPTRMWDFHASLDESLGASTIAAAGTTGVLTGVASKVTTALLSVGYRGLPQGWSTGARFGYVRTDFVNSPRDDNGWLAGANVSYEIWRNFGLTLDYQYKSVDSNVAGQSFDQHVVTPWRFIQILKDIVVIARNGHRRTQMRMILVVIFTAFCMLGSVSISAAGTYQSNGQYTGTPSTAVTAAFAAYPNGGDGLVTALLNLLLNDPTLADDIAWVASRPRPVASDGQQSAAAAALAQAFIVLTNKGDTTGAGRITVASTLSGNPVLQTAVLAAVAATQGSNPYQSSNPAVTTNARCTTTPADNTVSPARPGTLIGA